MSGGVRFVSSRAAVRFFILLALDPLLSKFEAFMREPTGPSKRGW